MPDRDAAVRSDREACLDLQQVWAAVLRVPEAGLDVIRIRRSIGAIEADRGHVPVDASHIDAELSDRLGSDGADDACQLGSHRIERPTDAVIVQDLGSDGEHLFDRPGPGPVLDMDKWRGRGQPAGHQGLDHLAVGDICDVTHRAGSIDDATDVETSAELCDHRECPECLFHTGFSVADLASWHGDLLGDDCIWVLEACTPQVHKTRIPGRGDDG